MIRPNPESDLSSGIIVSGADLIEIIKNEGIMSIEELLNKFLKQGQNSSHQLFFDVLLFLYIVDAIDFDGSLSVRLNNGHTQSYLF